MPKTRRDVTRDEKVTEILEAAERRLKEGGYSALSVAGLARELGLAHNAIYWYFPSKDHLVVATFEHIVHKLLMNKPNTGHDVVSRILWFVDRLAELYPLRASMHEHARRSDVIAGYLDELNGRLRTMVGNVLSPYVNGPELEVAAATFIATVQGAYLEGLEPQQRRRLLTFALERLIMEPGSHE